MPRHNLTPKQQTVLAFLHQFFTEYHKSPLIREIQHGCQIISYKSAVDRLNALEHKGFIRRMPGKHRGIEVVKGPEATAPEPSIPEEAPTMQEVL